MYETINLGNHQAVSLNQMISRLEDVFQTRANIKRLPTFPGDVQQTYASDQKAEKLLGQVPRHEFEGGLMKFKDWLFRNLDVF